MVQIRNMPDELHGVLKARAAAAGMSLSDYLLRELTRSASVLSNEEMLRRLASRRRVDLGTLPTEILREERDRR